MNSSIGTQGVIAKFGGINPQLPVDRIADAALDIERHSVKELLMHLAGTGTRQLKTA